MARAVVGSEAVGIQWFVVPEAGAGSWEADVEEDVVVVGVSISAWARLLMEMDHQSLRMHEVRALQTQLVKNGVKLLEPLKLVPRNLLIFRRAI